jgi:excisionase family DNA binding protein
VTALAERGVFDVLEAAAYLHMGENAIRDLLKKGELVGWRTQGPNRGDWRISKAAADEWIAQQEARGRTEVGR